MEKNRPESKLNSKATAKDTDIDFVFKCIEGKYEAQKIILREYIAKEKENWLRETVKLSREEYNFLWDFFFESHSVERTVDNQELFFNQFVTILVMLSDALKSGKLTYGYDRKLAERILKLFS